MIRLALLLSLLCHTIQASIAGAGPMNCGLEIQLQQETDLDYLRECPQGTFNLREDIVVTKPFTPLPPFYGVFHGNGHMIRVDSLQNTGPNTGFFAEMHGTLIDVQFNVTITRFTNNMINVGLMAGFVNSTALHNVKVIGSIKPANQLNSDAGIISIGGLAGISYLTPSNVSVSATITYYGFRNSVIGGVIGNITRIGTSITNAVISNLTFNGTIESFNNAFTAGSIAGDCSRSLVNCTATLKLVNIRSDWVSTCIYGGLVGVQRGSVASSSIYIETAIISQIDQASAVGGFVGLFNTTCIHCIILNGCRARYKQFVVAQGSPNVGGFTTAMSGILANHSAVEIETADVSGMLGGFATLLNNSNIIECAINIKTLRHTSLGTFSSAGFATAIKNDSNIKDCYVRIERYSIETTLNTFGGFVGTMIDSSIVNCFTWITTLIIQGSSKQQINIGGFCGSLYTLKKDTAIENSFAFIPLLDYSYRTRHELIYGAFIGTIKNNATHFFSTLHYLKKIWWYVNTSMECSTWNEEAKIKYSSFVAIIDDNTEMSDCYGTTIFTASCITFMPTYGLAIFINFAQLNYLTIARVLLNTTFLFAYLPNSHVFRVKAFGNEIDPSCCTKCRSIFIAANRGVDSSDLFSILPDFLMIPSTFLSINWVLDEEGGWQFTDAVFPILSSSPYVLVSNPNKISIITSNCKLPMCWNYKYIWNVDHSANTINLQFLTEAANCKIDRCAACLESPSGRCRSCSSGVLDPGATLCVPCNPDCLSCPTGRNVCEICANPSHVATKGVCIDSVPCVNVDNCSHCHVSASDTLFCVICSAGYWLNLVTNKCERCPRNCSNCETYTNCTRCANSRIHPIAGSCDYDTACIDNKRCKYCLSSDPQFCIICHRADMLPKNDGVCIRVDKSYCNVENCVLCEPGNSNRCSVCGVNTYSSFADGTCKYCPEECRICTPIACTRCTTPGKHPVQGICAYTEKCASPFCNYCLITDDQKCLLCHTGYILANTSTCIEPESNRVSGQEIAAIVLGVLFMLAGIAVAAVFILKKRHKMIKLREQDTTGTPSPDTDMSSLFAKIINEQNHTKH